MVFIFEINGHTLKFEIQQFDNNKTFLCQVFRKKKNKQPNCTLTVKQSLLISWWMSLRTVCCHCCYPTMKYELSISAPWVQVMELTNVNDVCLWQAHRIQTSHDNSRLLPTCRSLVWRMEKDFIHEKNKKMRYKWVTVKKHNCSRCLSSVPVKGQQKQARKNSYNLFTI